MPMAMYPSGYWNPYYWGMGMGMGMGTGTTTPTTTGTGAATTTTTSTTTTRITTSRQPRRTGGRAASRR